MTLAYNSTIIPNDQGTLGPAGCLVSTGKASRRKAYEVCRLVALTVWGKWLASGALGRYTISRVFAFSAAALLGNVHKYGS